MRNIEAVIRFVVVKRSPCPPFFSVLNADRENASFAVILDNDDSVSVSERAVCNLNLARDNVVIFKREFSGFGIF